MSYPTAAAVHKNVVWRCRSNPLLHTFLQTACDNEQCADQDVFVLVIYCLLDLLDYKSILEMNSTSLLKVAFEFILSENKKTT